MISTEKHLFVFESVLLGATCDNLATMLKTKGYKVCWLYNQARKDLVKAIIVPHSMKVYKGLRADRNDVCEWLIVINQMRRILQDARNKPI